MARDHQKLIQSLLDVGQELMTPTNPEQVLQRVLEISQEVFCFDNALVRLMDTDSGTLKVAASFGYPDADEVQAEIHIGQGVMGEVAKTALPLLVRDLANRDNVVPGIVGARCELAVPMISRGNVIGVINVESVREDAFSQADIAPLQTLAGQAAAAIDNARLVADLTRASEQNRSLAQLNERILHSVNLGIYTLDDQLRVTSWNAAMEMTSGIEHADAVGRKLFELFPRLESEGFADRVRRVLKEGKPERFRLNHRNLSGEMRTQKRRIAPLKDGPRIVGVVVIIEDVTEFRRLMDQTIQSEKLAEVGRLSAGIAHEINNPLAVISYGAQLILREEGLSPDLREVGERISSEADRLQTLTGGLLSFSRAKGAVKRWVDLNAVVEDVVRLVRYQFQRQSLEMVLDLDELPHVWADDNRLKQVLINLMLNAAQAMERKGRLEVRSKLLDDQQVRLTIADNGPGIPPEVLPKIFDPFFTTKPEGEGTGLGLYICRNIMQEHEGDLRAESSEKGACFVLTLPVGEGT